LRGADVRESDFTGAKMEGTKLDDIKAEGAIFPEISGGMRAFSLKALQDDSESSE